MEGTFILPRIVSERHLTLQIARTRVKSTLSDHKKLIDVANREMACWRGEQSMDYYYRYMPRESFIGLHQLRLKHLDSYFQIDTSLLYKKFIMLLEIKNIKGDLLLDHQHGQLIRTLDGRVDVFEDPVAQLRQQIVQLGQWLDERGIGYPPIYGFVVFVNANSRILTSDPYHEHHKQVIRPKSLYDQLATLLNHHHREYPTFENTAQLLKANHKPKSNKIVQDYKIKKEHIIPGVACPKCDYLPISCANGFWRCPLCKHRSKNAHYQSLFEYSLLNSEQISKSELKDFLCVGKKKATRLLNSLNYPYSGETKGRKYQIK